MSPENHLEIYRSNLCTHVTAIKALHSFLFVAECNQVSVFNLTTKKIIHSEIVFLSSSIHGIKSNGESKILFFGSKSLRSYFFDATAAICLISCTDEILLSDWIFDVQWLSNVDTVAVITAHNCLTVLNIYTKEIIKISQCAEKCILYAANVISAFESALVIAVGTVFRQILLWSPNSSSKTGETFKPLHCLEGHNGVIFSISYNKDHKLLSSTSDDRSIRLWKVDSVSCDDSCLDYWEKANISPSHVLYAHESRVWTSAVLKNCILSIGEDSCICFWNMNGELLKKKKCHKGGSIWCLETNILENNYEEDCVNNYIAFTGGSDGGVYCWDLKSILSKNLVSQISLHARSSPEKDFPRVVSIIFCDGLNIIATTDQGWLSFYDMNKKTWIDVYYDVSYKSYCVSEISSKSSFIALGNLNGDLVLLNPNDLSHEKIKIHSGKIFALHWVSKKTEYLLSCGADGLMVLWKVDFQNKKFRINKLAEFHLPKCKPHWWSTCAIFIRDSSSLIVGDRGGNINFYLLDTEVDNTVKPTVIHKCIHGENGVTDIQEHGSVIYSAGRDGRALLFTISQNSLNLLYSTKVSHDLEWIGKMIFYGSDLLLVGFHTKYFIVWSTALESTVMTVECGGGHRSWDFHLTDDGQATFTAIKKKDIIFTTESLKFVLNESAIKAGVSGREFCETCYLFTHDPFDSESMSVFAAGGEDNTLRIIGCINEHSRTHQLITLHRLSGHLSSIRSLAKINMKEENTYLLVSVGGRAQMILWKIKNKANIECAQLCSYILTDAGNKNKKSKENQNVQVDPQTRLMDVTINSSSTNSSDADNFIIALACSDSYFRVYQFNYGKKKLSLCYSVQLGEHCILKLASIQNSEWSLHNIFFITANTNGHLIFISHEDFKNVTLTEDFHHNNEKCSFDSKFQIHLHQSGINAIDVKPISGNTWLICTGGDDNALSVVIMEIFPSVTDCKVIAKTKNYSAHSSQITGIKILENNTIISASIDQRINLWKWHFHENLLTISMSASKMSAIPDIAHLECWKITNSYTVALCGEGIEILSIKNV